VGSLGFGQETCSHPGDMGPILDSLVPLIQSSDPGPQGPTWSESPTHTPSWILSLLWLCIWMLGPTIFASRQPASFVLPESSHRWLYHEKSYFGDNGYSGAPSSRNSKAFSDQDKTICLGTLGTAGRGCGG
jgi:hypothetical protein